MPVSKNLSRVVEIMPKIITDTKFQIAPVKDWSITKATIEGKTWSISFRGEPIELMVHGAYSPFELSSLNENSR